MKNPRNPLDLYARPDAGTDKTRWQRLDAHLRQVANLAAGLDAASETSPLDAPDAAENATRLYPFILGLLHDLGKAHPAFQRYLEESAQAEADGTGEKRRAPIKHSEAGAAWARQTFGPFLGTLFAYVVAGHHADLPDYLTDGAASLCNRLQNGGQTTLQQLQRNATERLAPFVAEIEKVAPLLSGDDSDELGRPVGLTQSNLHFFVRFLFSRLVDADRLDSEAFADPETAASRGKFASIPELYAKFNAYMERFAPENLPSTDDANVQKLRNLRADVLTACREKGRNDLRNRLYELTVPTGGGKTLSSLAFALERAQAAGLDRVVYVVPYTSIIEQTAAIFREIFGDANVVEHHSNFDAEETAAKRASQNASKNGPEIDVETTPVSEYALKARLATENWDAPIIVTTNVQFFESLYSAQGSRCRKLWRLERSVVVLDEAQTLPPRLLSPCVAALKALPELFETTLVLCTATQPTLSRLKELAPPNMTTNTPQLPQPMPIIDDESELYATLARVRYVFDENLNPDPSWAENPSVRWAQIATELEACGKIVSTDSTAPINPIDATVPTDATAAQVADVKKRLGLASGDVADVLCVVNTRRDCYDLYEKLKRRDAEAEARAREAGTFDESTAPITLALSALMCGAHRAKVVEQIREILARNRALPPERRRPLRVISTQVIEAGVDVDFPVVFRALAGLDSIAQAAGRCNREGRLGVATEIDPRTNLPRGGLVRVFTPPKPAREDLGRGQAATRAVLRNLATPFDGRAPKAFETFFQEFYRLAQTFDAGDKNIQMLKAGFVSALTSNVGELVDEDGDEYAFPDEAPSVPFRTVGEKFRIIDDDYSAPVYVLYGEGAALIDRLETLGPTRELTRKLRRYAVNLPKDVVFELLKDGRVEESAKLPGVYVQRDPLDYDAVFGYDVYNDGSPGKFLEI